MEYYVMTLDSLICLLKKIAIFIPWADEKRNIEQS